MGKEKEMVRVNTRISATANEWLDNQSAKTGLSKSAIIMLAIENYIQQKEAFVMMSDLGQVMAKLEKLEEAIQRNVQE